MWRIRPTATSAPAYPIAAARLRFSAISSCRSYGVMNSNRCAMITSVTCPRNWKAKSVTQPIRPRLSPITAPA
ncbi:hypothetical protein D3C72_1940440 [compost metagenome]